MVDFEVQDCGSVAMIVPKSVEAKDWLDENVQSEGWQWLGAGLAVEPRMLPLLLEGIADAGLSVEA